MQKLKQCPPVNNIPGCKLLLSTLILSALTGTAYAGGCSGTLGNYTCSGAVASDVTQSLQSLPASPLTVSTEPGFGIETSSGNAFSLMSDGPLTFTDDHQSIITGNSYGIQATSTGSGALSITTTGLVTGLTGMGLYAETRSSLSTDITIKVAEVVGSTNGIMAGNYGSGVLSVTASGTVIGINNRGIYLYNEFGTDLTLNAAEVSGGNVGIEVYNDGYGMLSVTTTGAVTGTRGSGIIAVNSVYGTDLIIQATGNVSGGTDGIMPTTWGQERCLLPPRVR